MMPSKEEPDGGISSSRPGSLESPLLGELFVGESGQDSRELMAALEAASPFLAAFEGHAETLEPVDEEAPASGPCPGVIGQDDRVQVHTPWTDHCRWICQISGRMRKNGKLQRFGPVGTGVLISPRYVLTAAHLLRESERDGRAQWVDSVAEELVVTPARNDDAPGDLKEPFGRFEVRGWKFAPGYNPRAADSWRHDYAIIELKEPAGAVRKPVLNHRPLCFWGSEDCGNGTRLEVVAPQDVEGQTAYTAGYPYDRGGGHRLMFASGRLSGVDVQGRREIMDFKADVCKGQSGSPIWITRENRLCLVGIVTKGGTGRDGVTGRVVSNRAIRFSREVFDQVSKWFEAVKETPWLGAGEIGDELESEDNPEAAVEEAFASEALEQEWHPEELESYQTYVEETMDSGLLESSETEEPRATHEETLADEEESGSAGDHEYGTRAQAQEEAEDFGTFEDHLDDAEKPHGEIFEYDSPQSPAPRSFDAQLVINESSSAKAPVELALIVNQWGESERKKVGGVRLKLFECDVGEPGRTDAAAAQDVQMAEFSLELAPNPAPGKALGGGSGIPRVSVVAARWANPTLEKSYRATKSADLVLKLGRGSFPLWISRQDIHEEGRAVELGFVLEDGSGNRVERMSVARGEVVSIPVPDYLNDLLGIAGRFDDPMRDSMIDMDGTRFDEFIPGKNRREFITRWLEDHPALKEAANEPGADLKTSDINKAWFILHDVGAKATLTDRRFKADQPKTKAGAVHGYLNRNGYYAATHDFTKNRQGTVYEFLSKNGFKIANGRTINIETVPDIEADVADTPDGHRGAPSNAEQYASIGYRRLQRTVGKKTVRSTTYYKWTTTALDVLADLYVFASARARHLLTITVHKEMDRNLGQSVIWREYSAAEIRKAGSGTFLGKARDNPHDYHGDPYGFNLQALYDIITQKLNALRGKKMPSGARYGVHPRRVCKVDGEDITNGSHHLHVFPHQSDPEVKIDTGLKKRGWWNAKQP